MLCKMGVSSKVRHTIRTLKTGVPTELLIYPTAQNRVPRTTCVVAPLHPDPWRPGTQIQAQPLVYLNAAEGPESHKRKRYLVIGGFKRLADVDVVLGISFTRRAVCYFKCMTASSSLDTPHHSLWLIVS
jgi:hypothetical protein